jgi:hypothetical protein
VKFGLKGGLKMTQTIQDRSVALVGKAEKGAAEKELPKNNNETDDNLGLLLQVFNGLNTLCDRLTRLDRALHKVNTEHNLCPKGGASGAE